MIDFARLGSDFAGEMEFRGMSVRAIAKELDVAVMTVMNIRNGNKLTADIFIQACLYLGVDPRSYWRQGQVSYAGMQGDGGVEL